MRGCKNLTQSYDPFNVVKCDIMTLRYTYNNHGQKSADIFADGIQLNYDYDAKGRVSRYHPPITLSTIAIPMTTQITFSKQKTTSLALIQDVGTTTLARCIRNT